MDEPLSNLDTKLRCRYEGRLIRLHKRVGTTTVYVTHDQVEAMTLGDRLAVLRDGVLQQCDTLRSSSDSRPTSWWPPSSDLHRSTSPRLRSWTGWRGLQTSRSPFRLPLGSQQTPYHPGVRPATCSCRRRPGRSSRVSARVDLVEDLGVARHV